MAKIMLSFKKSFLEKEGLTKEGMERCLFILAKEFRKAQDQHDFEYFKKRALACLKKQYDALSQEEKEEKKVSKAFILAETELEKAFPVGTIRTWKGKKFIKSPDKKWRPYYEKKGSQGEKLALAALAKKINALQDGDYEGLYKLITLQRSRFTSDGSLIKDLYNAMKVRGALGNGRFSKKDVKPKEEMKPEPKKDEAKPKESEKEEEKKDEPFEVNGIEIKGIKRSDFEKITKDLDEDQLNLFMKEEIRSGNWEGWAERAANDVIEKASRESSAEEAKKYINELIEGSKKMAERAKEVYSKPEINEEVLEVNNDNSRDMRYGMERINWVSNTEEGKEKYEKWKSIAKPRVMFRILRDEMRTHELEKYLQFIDKTGLFEKKDYEIYKEFNFDKTDEKNIGKRIREIHERRDFEGDVMHAIGSGTKINGIDVSKGVTFHDLPYFSGSLYDSHGTKKVICQYMAKHRLSKQEMLQDDHVYRCEAVIELALEALRGEPIKETGNRKYYEKNGVIAVVEKIPEYSHDKGKMVDTWHLKRVDIDTKQKDASDKATKERVEYIKNTPSRKDCIEALKDLINGASYISFEKAFDMLEKRKIEHVVPKRLEKPLSEEKIIENLAFNDNEHNKDGGYCASLALLYTAAKCGFDVTNHKGEKSRDYFSANCLTNLDNTLDVNLISDHSGDTYAECARNLLDSIGKEDFGKQYFLVAGSHASIVRKIDDGKKGKLQYLELQGTGSSGGWKDFTKEYRTIKDCLNQRFGCKKADKHDKEYNDDTNRSIANMFSIDEMKEKLKDEQYCNDFSNLLGYLNTKE